VRVLAITKIFPNAAEPLSAPFNRQQFAALARLCELEVLATIPWFPGAGLMSRWSTAGRLAKVPAHETIEGISVAHPRTLFLPRLAHATWGPLYAASLAPQLHRYRGKADVVLGSWAYPDGFAAVIAARLLGIPCVVKLHGSDVNVIAKMPGPRRLSKWALPRARRVVAVSRPLGDEIVALGVPRDHVRIVMNGVDADLFHPRDRAAARRELGLPVDAAIALYVGNLKPEKGIVELATAWPTVARGVRGARLEVLGGGPLKQSIEEKLAGEPTATVHGPKPLPDIPTWMAACDVLVLPSHVEGTPNVVLEALASGRRVVGTAVGGVPDLLTRPELGALVPPRDPAALADAIATALRTPYDPAETARHGARGGWAASAKALHEVLVEATGAVA
jgi:glycosyltransferase involved in cell wall biosynthesis